MLMSKDRQNLLKIITYDFLVVCMQVLRQHQTYIDKYLAMQIFIMKALY